MRCEKYTYAQVEACLYEAIRALIKGGLVLSERESKALIDTLMTKFNEFHIHDCLKPLETPPKKKKGKLYITDKDGKEVEYVRGQTIADYHNSQVKSKLQGARMTGNEDQLSKALGFIITLPKDYIETIIPDITDEEYEYYVKRSEAEAMHKPFQKNPELEKALAEKFGKHEWTEEEMKKAKKFLLAAKDCTLEEMGIRQEDVLFWAIHFDESWPHLHCMALPTKEKTYEEDVYSKKKKKDGTYSLLHKKGEKEISYSISRFYEKDELGEYKFFKELHPNVVKRMAEKDFDASGLINGATKGKGFSVSQLNHDQREESVANDRRIKVIEKKKKKRTAELNKKDVALNETKDALKKATTELKEKDALLQEKDSLLEEKGAELEALRLDVSEMEMEIAGLKDTVEEEHTKVEEARKEAKEAREEAEAEKAQSKALKAENAALTLKNEVLEEVSKEWQGKSEKAMEIIEDSCAEADAINNFLFDTLIQLGAEVSPPLPTKQMLEQKETYNQEVTLDEFNQTLSYASQIKVAVEKLIKGIFEAYKPRFEKVYKDLQPILAHFFVTELKTYEKVVAELKKPMKEANGALEVFHSGKATVPTANLFEKAVTSLEETKSKYEVKMNEETEEEWERD